jgi:hypothetical protein
MCKLFAIVEIESKSNAELFARKAIKFVTEHDDDGLGIMRLGENGVHIQRWVEVPLIPTMRSTLDRFQHVLELNRNTEGRRSPHELYGIGIHGRYATCEVNIQNTHPFYRNGSALMHNGIIQNHHQFDKPLSTCDSEALLTRYIDADAKRHPKHLTEALKPIRGYFAAIVFNDEGTIDVWRDDRTTLFMAHVKGVGVVIATTAEIILNSARAAKHEMPLTRGSNRAPNEIRVTAINEIKPFTVIRWKKGHNPIVKRFFHDTPVGVLGGANTSCGTQKGLFPDYQTDEFSPDSGGERGETWQENTFADDYALAKLRGFKGTKEDYFQQMEIELLPLEGQTRGEDNT